MQTFSVIMGYYVSQTINVEAEDYHEAIEMAYDYVDLPNITNKFEGGDDVRCEGVYDENWTEVYEGDRF